MKMYALLIFLTITSACKTSNTISPSKEIIEVSDAQNNKNYCPDKGNCTIKLHKNSSLILKKDTTDNYYPVIEEGENMVVEYSFLIKGPEGTADGDYSETLHFEINQTSENLTMQGEDLKQMNMLFGKHCFCRGEAGYYRVEEGSLAIQKTSDKITIDLSFILNDVSHKVIRIKESIRL